MSSPDVEILSTALAWRRAGHAVELVTVMSTWGSAPRPPGAIAVVRDDGAVAGSVSGGCIERELAEQRTRQRNERSSAPAIRTISVADDTARRVGLTCGGKLELIFESLDDLPALQTLVETLQARGKCVRELDLKTGQASLRDWHGHEAFHCDEQRMCRPFGPGWRLLLIGAGELSRHVARIALTLDFDVIVCEPRSPFRQAPGLDGIPVEDLLPDDAVQAYARDARSAVLALSHDPSLDDLALEEALGADCFYIGALGSSRSHAKRCERLQSLGVAPDALSRISGPIGLDIGSRTAAEIAVSIAAELIQVRARISA